MQSRRWQCRIIDQMAVVAVLALLLSWFYQLLTLMVIFAGPLLLALTHRAKGGAGIAGGFTGAVFSYCAIGIILTLLYPRISDHLFLILIVLIVLGVVIGSAVGAWLWAISFLMGKDLRRAPSLPAVGADAPVGPTMEEIPKYPTSLGACPSPVERFRTERYRDE